MRSVLPDQHPRARRPAVRPELHAGDVRDATDDYAQYVAAWTNALLLPPPPHVLELFGAAATHPAIASRFANGFDDPRDFFEWFMDPEKAAQYLADVTR